MKKEDVLHEVLNLIDEKINAKFDYCLTDYVLHPTIMLGNYLWGFHAMYGFCLTPVYSLLYACLHDYQM